MDANKECEKEVKKHLNESIMIVILFMSENIMLGIQKWDKMQVSSQKKSELLFETAYLVYHIKWVIKR